MNQLELSKHYLHLDINDFFVFDIEKLANLLEYHSDLYYNKENPIISDFEYDSLFKKLQILEEKFDIKEAQTHKVGSDITQSTFAKVKHSRPMISLDNTYNEEDLKEFDERIKRVLGITSPLTPLLQGEEKYEIPYTIEFKFDGLGVELIYKNGELVQAITRGNGREGEDVTVNVKTINNIPKTIVYKEHLEVRGEVVMPLSAFEELNTNARKSGGKVFSNPRNAASGSLRLLDASVTATRKLKFFAYDVANMEDFIKNTPPSIPPLQGEGRLLSPIRGKVGIGVSYFSIIKSLENFGFEISSYFLQCKNISEVIKSIDNFGDLKGKIDFDIDGLVIKVDDVGLWQDIGFTAHHPRYAIAYKFPAEILTTRILSVEHQVGRTGTITPVANLEPVFIGGVMVKRATLHNYEEVANLGVKVGDTIFIKRAGEVIPKIVGVVHPSPLTPLLRPNFEDSRVNTPVSVIPEGEGNTAILTPIFCPSCGTTLLRDDDKVRFYCPNHLHCTEQIKQKLIHSVGKQGLNIDGLGSEQVELFLEKGFISDLGDIFTLENKKDLILNIPGYKQKSVNNLLNAIENAKNQKIVNFLVALNISGIGPQGAKELSRIIHSNDNLLDFDFSLEALSNLSDIGEETAKNIYNFFHYIGNKILIQKLLEYIKIEYREEIVGGKYAGKKICITGSFEEFSRDELVEKLEKMGGSFVSSVSKNTDFLLAGEKAGSKLEKAKSLGINILSLNDFL